MTGAHVAWAPLDGYDPPAGLEGRRARLDRLGAEYAPPLWDAARGHDALWTFLPAGPPPDAAAFDAWTAAAASSADPAFYAIHDGRAWTGVAALMRIDRTHGTIEIGNILLSPALQRTAAATDAIRTLAGHAFDAGFRRLEWKCDSRNVASRRAARRLGFTEEGTFRQHRVSKGRNRDTTWFSILDYEWPILRDAMDQWLAPANFDAAGRQRRALSDLTAAATAPV